VKTDRNDCPFFFKYRPTKSFEAAKKTMERTALMQSSKDKNNSNKSELKNAIQEVESIETTLFYNKKIGKFRFGDFRTITISKTAKHKIRNVAEVLMEWWMKGKPCPKSELMLTAQFPLAQSVVDNISTIRKTLFHDLNVRMPQSTDEGYSPPKEPKHFNITE
jgi:hypothetical protein